MLLLTLRPDTSPARGPKAVAGGDVQEEVVESEGPVLENSLTYKRDSRLCVAWMGKGKVEGRGQEMEKDIDQPSSHQAITVPSLSVWKRGRTEMGTPGPH